MNNIIIGTAGHVDHGKTCLIQALTGIDTDRLAEEKKRGITIELGFAHLDMPDGSKAGIVDVPGHEKFIKNMLAGASGMDLVMLVVAADEGFMPQTREHLGIMSMINAKNGIVVLTKSDLVEKDWMEFVIEDVKNELKGTFLEGAPMIAVSSYTGEGIETLRQEIFSTIKNVKPKNTNENFRLPIDRVFTIKGFGTVITGTLIEGKITVGDTVYVYPDERTVKVRNLEVHDENVETAYAGQRVAVNLAAVKKEEIQRGDTLAYPESMESTMMLDVKLNLFSDTARVVENGSMLHLYHGTKNVLCKAVLMDRDHLQAGESCYAQLRLDESIAVKTGDHYIVRFYSPVETLGGGEILDSNPVKHKRNNPQVIERFKIKESGTPEQKAEQAIAEYSPKFADIDYISRHLMIGKDELKKELAAIEEKNKLVWINESIALHSDFIQKLKNQLAEALNEYHSKNPLQKGMRLNELKQRLMPKGEMQNFNAVISLFEKDNTIKLESQRAALSSFEIKINETMKKMISDIEKAYLASLFSPPDSEELQQLKYKDSRGEFKQAIEYMAENGVLINIAEHMYLHNDNLKKAIEKMEEIQKEKGEISLGDFRDKLDTSRKYALPILEYCDKQNITQRAGDLRKLKDGYLQRIN